MPQLFQVTFRCTTITYSYPSHWDIFASLQGRDPAKCEFKMEFAFDRRDLRWTGRCRCTGRSVPRCRPCKNGHSVRSDWEVDDLIKETTRRVERNLERNLDDIKTFYLACNDFTKFFSSSILLIFLQNTYLLVRRKINTLSFDLESTLKKYMRKYEGNLILKFGKRCELRDDGSEYGIYQYVRMPTSSGNIFPDFADISIRGELLAFSMSLKIIYRFFSVCHLSEQSKKKTHLMRKFEQCIFGMFFRKQMRKCK
jgi:hypothetical protein